MAFQDFDLISERRRNEKRQKMRKRIMIGVVSSVLLVGMIGAVLFVVVRNGNGNGNGDAGNNKSNSNKAQHQESPTAATSKEHVSPSQKMVKLVCSSADFKDKCEEPLNKAMQDDPKLTQPKDLLKLYVKLAEEEVSKAFNKTDSMEFQSEEEKGAFEDCKKLFQDAKDDIATSISELGKIELKMLSERSPDLNSWLSAVISFQQNCVDGFPEGNMKTDLQNLFKDSKEFVSNSLAILSQVASAVSTLRTLASRRRLLLSQNSNSNSPAASLDKTDGLPSWLNHDDRRILKATDNKPTPNVTVANDGSGDFKTISEALNAVPQNFEGRYVIYVKEGEYDEAVTVTKKMQNITMYGDGSQKSTITGSKNYRDGVRTFQTASFVVEGDGFIGLAMGFRNTAGPEGHQAVAARVQADRAVFANCRFEGYQDTLYTQAHRQFYRSCIITGTIDFIFGDAAVVLQNCNIFVRKPLDNQQNMVTAQGRMDRQQATGIVLQKCEIKPDDSLVPEKDKIRSYLGRPWKEYSRTIVMESEIDDFIHPDGWAVWMGDFALKTLYYAEYSNTGPGASTNARVNWPGYKVIDKDEASKFTVGSFLKGTWLNSTGVPTVQGLYN
ncbi:pectinesterase/pectinesterase inhibitor 13 [Spatholobus suberectus]|nr:pectinesterase/pectinesterase inhibitor 13 [Spatholobus suberectus]